MFVKRSIHLFVLTVAIALATPGQTPTTPTQDTATDEQKKAEAKATLNAQALELLDAVIKDKQRLSLPQNRAYLSVTTGDLLWQYDEQAARALFKDAIADLRAILSEPAEGESAQAMRQRMERAHLREKVLFALAKHDSRMTLDLLAETRPQTTTDWSSSPEREAELETRLAAVIAANDPAFAVEMVRKSLAKGFNHSLTGLLSEIRMRDPVVAAELAGDILAKLKTTSLATNPDAASVAVAVFEMATGPVPSKAKQDPKETKPLLTEQSLRELAELIAAAVLDGSQENSGYTLSVVSVMAQLEKYAPSRTQQLRRKFAQSGGEIATENQFYQNRLKLMEKGTAEDFIAAAEKADPPARESYYRQAAIILVNDDKTDQARQLITEHISDPDQRQQMLAELDKQVLSRAASKGKMEETRKLISTVSAIEERIAILTQLAMAIAEKGDKKIAIQILEEAQTLSAGRPRYSRQLLARLLIARAYVTVSPAQSLAILETTIDQLNELIGAAIVIGEFLGEEEFMKDDELLIMLVGQFNEMFQQQYSKDLALLATADFVRTREAADKFQRFEVRIMARLLVAQSVLMQKEIDKDKLAAPAEGTTRKISAELNP